MGANHIAIIDMDIVEISNLHRQTLYDEEDAYHLTSKVQAVKEKLRKSIQILLSLLTMLR